MDKTRKKLTSEVNNRVPVVLECYRNVEWQRVVHSPFGPVFKTGVLPTRGYWVPEPPPVQYLYRPIPVALPYKSNQGPLWYPSSPMCSQHASWDSTSSASSPHPISTSTPRMGVNLRDQKMIVQRKPITITKPPEPQQNQSKKVDSGNKVDKNNENSASLNKSNKVKDHTSKTDNRTKSDDCCKSHESRKTRHRKDRKGTIKDKKPQNVSGLQNKNRNKKLYPKVESSQCQKMDGKIRDIPTETMNNTNLIEEEILKESKDLCIRVVEEILKDDMEWTIADSVHEEAMDVSDNQDVPKDGDNGREMHAKDTEMSSPNSETVKSTKNNEVNSSESTLKRSLEDEGNGPTQSELSSSVRFTPPQVYKIKRMVQNSKTEERNSSKECSKYLVKSPSSSASVATPTLKSPKRSTSEVRTPIIWDDTILAPSKVRSATRTSKSGSLSNGTPESSIFITPESTPKSIEVVRPRFKRSLSDHFEDGNSSHELSQNSSAYFTPDSSPGEYVSCY
ncbi:uncharacterized protein LOC124357760 [Homalodisca vitripennis]|uniref:uncharacterized protein LOC124357760 n=1 Tax=Homalodisca vitripennis TaxID=197043 RepID=UPI001EEAD1AB|nr:uncharacterized protein LOC124357760 [Homalodisca vitripennis]